MTEGLFEFGYGYFAIVEYAGGQGGIGMSFGQHLGNVVRRTGATRCYDGNAQTAVRRA